MLSNLELGIAIISAIISIATAVTVGVMRTRCLSREVIEEKPQAAAPRTEKPTIRSTGIVRAGFHAPSAMGNVVYGRRIFSKEDKLPNTFPVMTASALPALSSQECLVNQNETKGEWSGAPYRFVEKEQSYTKAFPEASRQRQIMNLTAQAA
jgi:hypothetical protein